MPGKRLWILVGASSSVIGVAAVVGVALAAVRLDPRVALTAHDQAAARQIVLQRSDLGAGWKVSALRLGNRPFGSTVCPGFSPDLSRLTIQGRAGTRAINSAARLSAVTEAFLLASRAQARAIHRALAAPFIRQCFRPGTSRGGAHIDSVSQDSLLRSRAARFRLRMTIVSSSARLYGDYIFLQTGRAWITIVFAGTGTQPPTAIEERALRAVSRQIRG